MGFYETPAKVTKQGKGRGLRMCKPEPIFSASKGTYLCYCCGYKYLLKPSRFFPLVGMTARHFERSEKSEFLSAHYFERSEKPCFAHFYRDGQFESIEHPIIAYQIRNYQNAKKKSAAPNWSGASRSIIDKQLQKFKYSCGALACSHAHGHHAVFLFAPSHLVEQLHAQLCSAAS